MTWKHYAGISLFLIGMFTTIYSALMGLLGKADQEIMLSYGVLGIIVFMIGLILLGIERLQRPK